MNVWQIQIALPLRHAEMKNVLIHVIVQKMLIVRLVTIEEFVIVFLVTRAIHMESDAHPFHHHQIQDVKKIGNVQAKKHA